MKMHLCHFLAKISLNPALNAKIFDYEITDNFFTFVRLFGIKVDDLTNVQPMFAFRLDTANNIYENIYKTLNSFGIPRDTIINLINHQHVLFNLFLSFILIYCRKT